MIHRLHAQSRGTYGSPRIHADLQAEGRRHGRKRVARLMRQAGLAGLPPAPAAPPHHRRRPGGRRPPRTWCSATSTRWRRTACGWPTSRMCPTGEGWLYLAAVLDAFSRRVVGWAMADHLRTELVLDALEMALATRRPAAGLVHHSDRGLPVHLAGLRAAPGRVRARALDEPGGQLLRQRRGRELLRHPQAGAGRPPRPRAVARPGRRPGRPSSTTSRCSTTAGGATPPSATSALRPTKPPTRPRRRGRGLTV